MRAVGKRDNEVLAGEAWRLISEMFMSRRHRFDDVATSLDLTAGDLHTLLSLEPGTPGTVAPTSTTFPWFNS